MIFKVIHSFVKNTIIFVSPFVIISLSFAINLPDVSLHKKVLNENNFYEKITSQISLLSKDIKENRIIRSTNLAGALNQSYFGYVLPEVSNQTWWRGVVESNLDNFQSWLNNGDYSGQGLKLLWPDNQINGVTNSSSADIAKYVKDTSSSGKACTAEQLKQNSANLAKLDCYFSDLNSIQNSSEKKQLLGSLSTVDITNFSWFTVVKYIKVAFNFARYFAIPIAVVYILLLASVIVSSYIVKGHAKKTSEMLFGRIGYSTLFVSVSLLIAVNGFSYFGLQAGNLLGEGVAFSGISMLLQQQLSYHIWAIISPAIFTSIIFIAFNLVLKVLPKF